jgi:sn-glycerol 3-phosphate transport system ATP-binding protein
MNLLPAGVLAKCPELLAGMPAGHAPEALIAGVRPESVALAQAGLQARIIAAEYLGADTQVETRVGEETVIVRRSGRFAAPAGANIYLKWRPQDAHWFEASSHRRIAGK